MNRLTVTLVSTVVRAILRITGGVFLVILGIVGLILPIMPGWVFLIPGLVMLQDYFPPIKRLVDWGKRRVEKMKSTPAN